MFQVLHQLPSLISKAKISVNMMSNHPETRTELTPATLSKLNILFKQYVTASTRFQPQRVIMR